MTKFLYPLLTFVIALVSCTHKPDVHTPDNLVMHFPIYSKVSSDVFIASSSSADGKYDFGRLSLINLDAVAAGIGPGPATSILHQEKEVSSVFIPKEIGALEVTDDGSLLMFTQIKGQGITFMPFNQKLPCENNKEVNRCPDVKTFALTIPEPSSIAAVNATGQTFAIVGSSSEGRIELVSFDGTHAKKEKSHDLTNLIDGSKKKKAFLIRQIKVDHRSPTLDTYLLLEEQKILGSEYRVTKNTHLVKAKWDTLLNQNTLSSGDVEMWDLRADFGISLAMDFMIDHAANQLILLAGRPEMLFKINLANKDLLNTTNVCRGASMMAFDEVKNQLYIPCFYDETVVKIAKDTLRLDGVSPQIAGGPLFVSVDPKRDLVFVSSFNKGVVEVLGSNLEPYGYLFKKAPKNRVGS